MHDDEGYRYHTFKYLGKIPFDILNGEVSDDDYVLLNLTRVARLRAWINHLQFGIITFEDTSVCRMELGLGRGYTKWVTMWEMARYMDVSDFIKNAKDKHRLNKLKRRSSNRSSGSVNYTIGALSDQNSASNRSSSVSIIKVVDPINDDLNEQSNTNPNKCQKRNETP